MIIYVDETKDSKAALQAVLAKYPDVPVAPASGSGLPELVLNGMSFIGVAAILAALAGMVVTELPIKPKTELRLTRPAL
jgi:hypothetical protein